MRTDPTDGVLPENENPEIERFLRYYEAALDACSARLALFILPNRQTIASRDIGTLASRAAKASAIGRDVYFHLQLHDLVDGEGSRRGSTETARMAIGLFSDIDARGPGRKKPAETLCPTLDDAVWVVERFNELYAPVQASLVIGSGHGCYPVVLFREPLLLTGAEDAALLESLGRRFHHALHSIASDRGWTGAVDFCDAAKVLRLPGTVNFKDPANPAPVRLIFEGGARFNPGELDELLPQLAKGSKKLRDGPEPALAGGGGIVLNPDVEVAAELLDAMTANHPAFAATWNHRRADLADPSCSGYDMALAGIGVACGLPDQQVADLLIRHRARYPKPKQERRGPAYRKYLQRTIDKARAGQITSAAAEREWLALEVAIESPSSANAEPDLIETDARDGASSGEPGTSEPEPSHPYRERPGGIVRIKASRDGSEEVIPLTNFTARITSNIGEDDGVEVKRFFGIDAQLTGNLCAVIVPANRFAAMEWAIELIGPTAIVHPNQKDWARAAVQSLSDHVVERRIYTHTGWRRVGETMMYLHGGGAIGPSGAIPEIDVRLSGALVNYALVLPESRQQLVEAVRASLHVLEVAYKGRSNNRPRTAA